jgi:decaprenylphospho-beta-D-ribofuranose 2-oxidase
VAAVARQDGTRLLARGLGRAYGDAALLSDGFTLLTERLDRFLGFDPETGWLRCEAGVTIDDIIRCFLPRGFFPPVVPGTRFVTVAGALASDIHGKNHHVAGSWSSHVRRVEVLTASGEVVQCDSSSRPELFWATAGGMGLTAIILSLEVRLARVHSSAIEMESIRVRNLDEFFEVSAESSDWPYTVGWVDGLKGEASLGRGMFMRGRHAPTESKSQVGLARLVPPLFLNGRMLESNLLLNRATVRIFNAAYYRKNLRRAVRKTVAAGSFFFPLDAVANWNRIYGRRGFLQYQFVMPPDPERRGIRTALAEVAGSGVPSFLGVVKEFGDERHGGLSFPIPGVTVALDFPNVGEKLFELLERLDDLVVEAGGRVYLTKDARLNKKNFRRMYPDWERWKSVRDAVDPDGIFQSELGRRLGLVGE